jgi:hypothetical protein
MRGKIPNSNEIIDDKSFKCKWGFNFVCVLFALDAHENYVHYVCCGQMFSEYKGT